MRSFLYFVLTAFTLSLPVLSQEKDDEDDDSDSDRRRSSWTRTKLGGAGGITPMIGMFDNTEIDKYLLSAKMPTFGQDPLYLIGGEGYGYIMFLRNVRMGGFGVSGTKTVNKLETMSGGKYLRKEVEYEVSYGGFLMDYVQPVANRLDIAIGASIGGGSINITMMRDDGSPKRWDSLWSNFGDTANFVSSYKRNLNGSFVTFTPHISIEYTILTWLQIRVGAGYPMMFSREWKLDDKYEIDAMPSKVKVDGYTVNAGLMFGFFGW